MAVRSVETETATGAVLSLDELRAQFRARWGGTLSSPASLSSADARRQAEPRTVAGLGAEPLLLPEHYSD